MFTYKFYEFTIKNDLGNGNGFRKKALHVLKFIAAYFMFC